MKKKIKNSANHLVLHLVSPRSTKGVLRIGHQFYSCAIGKNGIKPNKTEGDGTTPKGIWALGSIYFRPDKLKRPRSHLKTRPIHKKDLWCDDPKSSLYNRPVKSPFIFSAEKLWRDDAQYDLLIVVKYNMSPCVKYKGSAIFIHVRKNAHYPPTEGCLVFRKSDLLKIIKFIGPRTRLHI